MAVEVLSSNVVNYLVWRYLQEAGKPHALYLAPHDADDAQDMAMPRSSCHGAGIAIPKHFRLQRTSPNIPSSTSSRMG